MPSWNIHIAHAERLLAKDGPSALGICDVDSFLLGSVLPDVYVGYMVEDITRKIKYRETHLADPNFVPEPRYGEFFDRFCAPDAQGKVSDLLLGSWAHLVADHHYNKRTNEFLVRHDIETCTETRIKKQGDFNLFGLTLDISLTPHITSEVLRQCASYPPYELGEQDMHRTQEVMEQIVASNAAQHLTGTPPYQMLGEDFFQATFDEVNARIREGLTSYAAKDAQWGAER